MHATTYSWPSFTTDIPGKMMPQSIPYLNGHIFEESINNANPHGKKMNMKYAMTLARYYWNARERRGSNPELYQQFMIPCGFHEPR